MNVKLLHAGKNVLHAYIMSSQIKKKVVLQLATVTMGTSLLTENAGWCQGDAETEQ